MWQNHTIKNIDSVGNESLREYSKKTICLVTNWYPTKDNPYVGCFFKEQAFAVSDMFDFVVFRYSERINKKLFSRDFIAIINREKNTIEYTATAYIPMIAYIIDAFYTIYVNHFSNKKIDGIGRYIVRPDRA